MDILKKALTFPLNFFQLRLLRPEVTLPEEVFLPVRSHVEREEVPPYWKGTRKGVYWLQAVIESSCWLKKFPRKILVTLYSS